MTNGPPKRRLTVGVDPGRSKCGYAAVGDDGGRVCVEVVPAGALERRIEHDVDRHPIEVICVGDATTSGCVIELCRRRWPAIPVVLVDERNTSLEARRLYYEDNPPGGLLRFVPRGLLVPKAPLDGYAALLIISRYRQRLSGGKAHVVGN
ncbi:MAG: resolvase [Candidatus Eremiobacteraeota bacterium]|nr:resolvase [Candidatus Eremiobacteraeota bacterium]